MREHILAEIKRVAAENGGSPPGLRTFKAASGISDSAWKGKIWARWGDALKEAGFQPNAIQEKYSTELLLRRYCEAARQLRKAPTKAELSIFAQKWEEFPAISTFYNHFGGMEQLRSTARNWAAASEDFADVVALIPLARRTETPIENDVEGYVYLLKSGEHYKIGRSDNVERRIKQITIAMPEEVTLVHAIRTDDPSGIETYWHGRFSDRRANGEWFKLSTADLRAFKRRKFQ